MHNQYQIGGYLPLWLTPDDYTRINGLGSINRLFVAFAVPDPNGKVQHASLNPAASSAISKLGLPKNTKTFISIGGWGSSPAEHSAILKGFAKGFDDVDSFSVTLKEAAQNLQQAAQLDTVGIDLDFEYPTESQAKKLPLLVDNLQTAGISDISMAVAAAGPEAVHTQAVARELAEKGVHFNVMTYDQHGPWSSTAGPLATTDWTLTSIDGWVQATGDASKVYVGFPTYCRTFAGASGAKDRFDQAATTKLEASPSYFKDLPTKDIVEDEELGSSSINLDNGWTACISPEQVEAVMDKVRQKYPDIGGAFVWDLTGMTPEYTKALQ